MKTLLLLLLSMPTWAQQWVYTYTKTSTLAAATEVVTIQLPAGSGSPDRRIKFIGAAIYCNVECAITLERDGTPATTSAAIPAPLNRSDPPAYAVAYYGSNVGAGTELAAYTIPSGATLVLDLSRKHLVTPGSNLTVRMASMTGTVKINLQWEER